MTEVAQKITYLLEKSFATRINNLEQSLLFSEEALELCVSNEHNLLKAKALSQMSLFYVILGRYDESYNLTLKSLKIYEQENDEIGIANSKYNLASFYYKTNNYEMGVVNLIDALLIFKKHNDYYNISRTEKALGTVYEYTGDIQKATQSHQYAIKAAKKINDSDLESNALNNLSGIYLKKNLIKEATELIQRAFLLKSKTGDTRGLAYSIYGIGKIHLALKEYTKAETKFKEALEIHLTIGDKLGICMTYNKLALLYYEMGDIALSKKNITIGLDICEKFSISLIKIKLLYLSFKIYKKENDYSKALDNLELYITQKDTLFNSQKIKIIENYDLLVKMEAMKKEAEFNKEKNKIIAKSNKIEQVARIRQEFLSTMSHEIRTPLNAVTTIAKILSENSHIEDKVMLNSLQFSANHLMQIINDILDYTKLDLGKMTLDLHISNIKTYLETFWNTYEIQAKEKGIEFKLKIDPKLADYYLVDETKLTQVLGNLVNNAIKFTDIGSVKLEIKVGSQGPKVDTINFKVSDTGVGIEKENLQKVFESFSQLKNGITRKKDGAGLGLSITKKIIELYNSDIQIQSIFGKGSIFSFDLKLQKSEDAVQNNQVSFKNDITGLKVLLAEDNAINAMIAMKLLSNWGIKGDHAKNGLEATEKAKLLKYDCILMDIHMPVLDGYQAAMNIKTLDNLNKDTPIYALTADIAAKDNTEYSHYFIDFLLKPFEIDKLKNALSRK